MRLLIEYMATQQVYFIGIGRLEEGRAVIIGCASFNTETDLSGVKRIIEQPNTTPGKHFTFQTGEVSWHLIQGKAILLLQYSFLHS